MPKSRQIYVSKRETRCLFLYRDDKEVACVFACVLILLTHATCNMLHACWSARWSIVDDTSSRVNIASHRDKRKFFFWQPSQLLLNYVFFTCTCDVCFIFVVFVMRISCVILGKINYYYYYYNHIRWCFQQMNDLSKAWQIVRRQPWYKFIATIIVYQILMYFMDLVHAPFILVNCVLQELTTWLCFAVVWFPYV